ncbi:hypothetical protein BG004_001768 [Podila humilis]|nr:hypothetical protein BG004_001768 [Podila humilis]
MPPSKSAKKATSAPKGGNAKVKASPYSKSAASNTKSSAGSAKKPTQLASKPTQARNKHKNMNLTSELDSLLGDLNSQLQRKKTKKDSRLGANDSGVSAAEQALNEAQAKHEALQHDMMNALDAIALLSSTTLAPVRTSPVPQAVFGHCHRQAGIHTEAVTILDVLGERPEFSKLLELIQKDNDLSKLLADPGTQPTLFAPTNEAFDSISDIDYPTRDILMYHISSQAYNASSLSGQSLIKSLYDSPGLNNAPQFLRIALEEPSIPSTSFRDSLWGVEPEIWIPELELRGEVFGSDGATLYVNRAKVTEPDLVAQSGGIVHGVDRIIRLPGETILDEVMRRSMHFTYLTKAWVETGVDARVRDGKSLTLFAPTDEAWEALPKKLVKWLFSDMGREHLKVLALYHIGNRALYTHDILNKTLDDGTPSKKYHEVKLQTLLNSPQYALKIHGVAKKSMTFWDDDGEELDNYEELWNLLGWKEYVQMLGDPTPPVPTQPVPTFTSRVPHPTHQPNHPHDPSHPHCPGKPGHHYPHKNPKHPHHHKHRHGKHHKHHKHRHHHDVPHHGDDGGGDGGDGHKAPKHAIRRDEIVVNDKAHIVHGHENWIAGNGVIHVVDKVLMPPRRKGCHDMGTIECSVWQTLWNMAEVEAAAAVYPEDVSLFDMKGGRGVEDSSDECENEGAGWVDDYIMYAEEEAEEQGQVWDENWTPIVVV